jgi:hypothetical protein
LGVCRGRRKGGGGEEGDGDLLRLHGICGMGTAREDEEKEEGDYLDDITMRVWRTSGVVVCDVWMFS